MQIICVFASGRMIDRSDLDETRIQELASEFPTINDFFYYF
jgi:hypothetical protein